MLARFAKPMFLTTCACNLAFSVMSGIALEGAHPALSALAAVGGGLSFVIAAALGVVILLRNSPSLDRPWVKAALVFLVLGPLAFWGLQMPAAAEVACIDNCYGADTAQIQARAVADVFQSQLAMIAVSFAAVLCAARALAMTLEELAL